MINYVVGFIILAVVGLAIGYIVKEKKKGVRCIGCPDSAVCSGTCSGTCGSSGSRPAHTE